MKGLDVNDVKIISENDDARPSFVLDDVANADFFHIKAPQPNAGSSTFALNGVTNFSLAGSRPLPDAVLKSANQKSL